MMGFKQHGVMLYLDAKLYQAFVKLQADKGLGRSFAGLLPFVEGLHQLGYLGEKEYEGHKKRYSVPLDQEPKQVELEQAEELKKEQKLAQTFRQVREQWDLHKDDTDWKKTWINKAKKYAATIPEAKHLLSDIQGKKVVVGEE